MDGATKHHVTYTSDNGASWSLAALEHPSNSITVTGLANSATYIVGVRAGNGGGWSGWRNSAPAGPYTPPTPEPTPEPTPDPNAGIIVQDADGNAVTALSVPEGGETSYQIKLASQPTQDVEVCIGLSVRDNDDSDITFKGEASDVVSIKLSFTPGNWDTAQTVTLVAAEDNDYANGARDVTHDAREYYSGKVDWTATEIDNDEITVTATRGDDGDTASVSWNAYIADDFSYYRVIVCTDAQYNGASCSGTVHKSEPIYNVNNTGPISVPDLDPGTGYGVILQTWRAGGAIKAHNTLPAGPAAPTNLTVTPGDGYLDIAWDAVSGATGYDVRAKKAGASDWHDVASNVSGTSHRYTTAETMDYVAVRARNADSPGNWTELSRAPAEDWLNVVIQGGASTQSAQGQSQLAAPTWGTITRHNGWPKHKLHLNWTAVSGASGYNVVCSDFDGWNWWQCGSLTSGTTTSLTINKDTRNNSELSRYRPYKLSIRAVNGNPSQASDWTESENIYPVSGHLLNLVATRSDGSITLTWSPTAWTTGYLIDCAVVTGSNPAYTRCASLSDQDDTAAEHTVTISTWTAGGTNYSINNTKTYDIKIISTNKWGQARTIAPVLDPYTTAARLTAGSIASTGATLTVNNYAGDWWYKRTSPTGDSTCHQVASGTTAALSSLTASTSYTYKAYDKTGCNNADGMGTTNFTTQSYPSVSNLSATSDGFGILVSAASSVATGFTTGDNNGGYTLRSVTVKFRVADALSRETLTVAVHAVSDGNPAATATHALSNNDPTGAGEYTFACSGDCSLSKETSYFLVLKSDSTGSRGFNWDTTASTDQTNTPNDFGWFIDDAAKWYYDNAWHAQSGWTGIFKVSATAK